ncbi:MAG: hypothetical protein LBT30_08050 [Clostridiales bacterium]|jgi:2-oxo-4-hydroxy-4-carboxy--5-ureidoimidazoline (OHCU) decarboxylase|nr:hypothetical protein [Clostridiales bacterium]
MEENDTFFYDGFNFTREQYIKFDDLSEKYWEKFGKCYYSDIALKEKGYDGTIADLERRIRENDTIFDPPLTITDEYTALNWTYSEIFGYPYPRWGNPIRAQGIEAEIANMKECIRTKTPCKTIPCPDGALY